MRMNGCLTQTPTTSLVSKSKQNKMAEVERSWSDEQLHSEEVSKKDIIKFLHEHASFEVFLSNSWVFNPFSACDFGRFEVCFQDNVVNCFSCFSFPNKQ